MYCMCGPGNGRPVRETVWERDGDDLGKATAMGKRRSRSDNKFMAQRGKQGAYV